MTLLVPLLLSLTLPQARAALPADCDSACLAKLLVDRGADIVDRHAAANRLWGTSANVPALALLAVGKDPSDDDELRGYCLRRLYWDVERLSDGEQRLVIERAMLELAKSGQAGYARRGAIWGLFTLSRRETVQPTLLDLARNGEPGVRYEAIKSLYLAMDEDAVFARVFDAAKHDREGGVRMAALIALSAALGRPEAVEFLHRTSLSGGTDAIGAQIALRGNADPEIRTYFHLPSGDAALGRHYPPVFE